MGRVRWVIRLVAGVGSGVGGEAEASDGKVRRRGSRGGLHGGSQDGRGARNLGAYFMIPAQRA